MPRSNHQRGSVQSSVDVAQAGMICTAAVIFTAVLLFLLSDRADAAAASPGDMVLVPAGEAIVGTSEEEARRLAAEYDVHPGLFQLESPRRTIRLPAFWIDRFPVTNAQFAEFCKATKRPSPWGKGGVPAELANRPVGGVDWAAAAAYAQWAGKRLPTAEEWEKAARGTDGRLYPWGNEWKEDATRIHDPRSPRTEPLTTPVGSFPQGASPYGVMDLSGNVAEWTATAAATPDPVRHWAWYVVKGASAAQSQRYHFRCAAQALSAHQSRRHPWLGFRCAKDASGAAQAQTPTIPAGKPLSPAPIPAGPRADLYGKEPIRFQGGAIVKVPYFPDSTFGLSLPEQVGAEGLPFGWSMPHTRTPWQVTDDGRRAAYEATFTGVAWMQVVLEAGLDAVDFTIKIRNLTGKPFTGVASNTCFQGWHSPYFDDSEQVRTLVYTDEGPTCALLMAGFSKGEPLHRGWSVALPGEPAPRGGSRVRLPIMATVSNDGQWIIAQAYAEATSVAGNAHYSCLHVRPKWPDIPAGETRELTGKLYFLRGGPQELLARWKRDFAK